MVELFSSLWCADSYELSFLNERNSSIFCSRMELHKLYQNIVRFNLAPCSCVCIHKQCLNLALDFSGIPKIKKYVVRGTYIGLLGITKFPTAADREEKKKSSKL